MRPAEAHITDHIEVAVSVDADPPMITGGVRTLNLILFVDTFLTHVATEMTLKVGPVLHRAVPGSAGAFKTPREFRRLQHTGLRPIPHTAGYMDQYGS